MKQDKWAERLEQHLADYRKSPDRDLWKGIEASLDKQAKHQTRLVSLRHWSAAAALAGILFGGGYMIWNRQMAEETNDTSQLMADHRHIAKPSQKSENQEPAPLVSPLIPVPHETTPRDYPSDEPVTCHQEEQPQTVEQPQTAEQLQMVEQSQTVEQEQQPVVEAEPRSHPRRQLTMNLYTSGGTDNQARANGVQMNPVMLQNYTASRGYQTGSRPYLIGYEERQNHSRPLSFGLSFSYPISDRLAVSFGVVYTKLSSDFLTVMQDDQIRRHQTLHYVGIPLNMQYHLWQWRGLKVYLSAGGQADWNVQADANTDGIDQKMDKDRMQWSFGGSLGVQYDILPHLGVYAEPGVHHYFDNGSNVSNYFKEKPTDFQLQLGIRFHWLR